jgi:hypothetical protein
MTGEAAGIFHSSSLHMFRDDCGWAIIVLASACMQPFRVHLQASGVVCATDAAARPASGGALQPCLLTSPADIRRACHMAEKLVFYYGMSEIGITTWAFQAYSTDFMIGSQRPRKVRPGKWRGAWCGRSKPPGSVYKTQPPCFATPCSDFKA